MRRALLSMLCFCLMMTPVLAAAMPVHSTDEVQADENWWERTNMDRNNNKIADMVEKYHDHELFLDEANTCHSSLISTTNQRSKTWRCLSARLAMCTSGTSRLSTLLLVESLIP